LLRDISRMLEPTRECHGRHHPCLSGARPPLWPLRKQRLSSRMSVEVIGAAQDTRVNVRFNETELSGWGERTRTRESANEPCI
jgi:hypothetical protein